MISGVFGMPTMSVGMRCGLEIMKAKLRKISKWVKAGKFHAALSKPLPVCKFCEEPILGTVHTPFQGKQTQFFVCGDCMYSWLSDGD